MTLSIIYKDPLTARKVIRITIGSLSTYTVQAGTGETMRGFKTKSSAMKLAKGQGFCNGLLFQ